MKIVTYIDGEGWKRRSLIKDDMLPEQASQGIPRDPPDVMQLDCEAILRELNNLLVDRELFTIADLNLNPGSLRNVVQAVLYNKLMSLYKNHHHSGLNGGNAPAVKNKPKEIVNEKSF
jgi:hypothetical protein